METWLLEKLNLALNCPSNGLNTVAKYTEIAQYKMYVGRYYVYNSLFQYDSPASAAYRTSECVKWATSYTFVVASA